LLIEPAFFASVFFPAMISPPGRACRGPKQSQRRAQIQTRNDVPCEKKGGFRVSLASRNATRGWSETTEMRGIALFFRVILATSRARRALRDEVSTPASALI
jgi:hypothetical protein